MVKEKGKTVVIEEYWDYEDGTYLVKVDGKLVPYDSRQKPYVKVSEVEGA